MPFVFSTLYECHFATAIKAILQSNALTCLNHKRVPRSIVFNLNTIVPSGYLAYGYIETTFIVLKKTEKCASAAR